MQAKLSAGSAARQLKLRASPSILAGRLFDDRGNRMTPTHTNKRGARYRYYVSHPILQKRRSEAGSVSRVPAHEIETTVLKSLRDYLDKSDDEAASSWSDNEVVQRSIERIMIKLGSIDIRLHAMSAHKNKKTPAKGRRRKHSRKRKAPAIITVPWTGSFFTDEKGVVYSPSQKKMMSQENRDALLTAIAKARAWVEDLARGEVASFAQIAKNEGKVERHIRLLAQLAFVSPKIISSIAMCISPTYSLTELAKASVCLWAEQLERLKAEAG